jgi:hypothetical protein
MAICRFFCHLTHKKIIGVQVSEKQLVILHYLQFMANPGVEVSIICNADFAATL